MTSHRSLPTFFPLLLLLAAEGLTLAQETRVSADSLIYDLQNPEASRRREAARLLGENRIRSAVPALVDATADRDESVRLEVARALVKINDTRALPAYIRLLSDDKSSIRERAIEGLVDVYIIDEGGFIAGVSQAFQAVNPLGDDFDSRMVEPYVPVSQAAIDGLEGRLTDGEAKIRAQAARALGILRGRSALPAIQSRLQQEESRDAKVELIRAAYKIGDPSVGEALVPLIDDNRKVRDEDLFAAGHLRIPEAAPKLEQLLDIEERRKILRVVPVSGKDDLQRRAMEALSLIGDVGSKGLFINSLADPRPDFRKHGAEGLGRIGEDDILLELARAKLREEAAPVRLAMAFALYRLGRQEHLVELVDSLKGRDQGYFYLLELQSSEMPRLYPFLESEGNPKILANLVEVIGLRGDGSALPHLERMGQRRVDAEVLSAINMATRRLRGRLDN